MKLKESKIILSKINLLFKNLMIDNKVSAIERDLMLSYVRQFYDEILNDDKKIAERIWDLTETYPFVNGYIVRFGRGSIENSKDLADKLRPLI